MSRGIPATVESRYPNWPLLIAVPTLLVIGELFIFSAGYVGPDWPVQPLYRQQLKWSLLGMFCHAGCVLCDYRRLRAISVAGYAVCLLLLVLTLVAGESIGGARRWLDLLGLRMQPAEAAKLATVLALAYCLPAMPGTAPIREQLRLLFSTALIVGFPFLLIAKEPALGNALTLVPAAVAVLYVAGLSWRFMGAIVLSALLVGGIWVGGAGLAVKAQHQEITAERLLQRMGLRSYQVDRLKRFLGSSRDPRGRDWNSEQSKIAVAVGGWCGTGFLGGKQKQLGYVPRPVAPTEFIFAVICEEAGFMGATIVIFLYLVVIATGLLTALQAEDREGRLLCVGIVAILFAHVVVNIAMIIGLLPITGLPLPLLSYGGSCTITTLTALGLIQSVWRRSGERVYDDCAWGPSPSAPVRAPTPAS